MTTADDSQIDPSIVAALYAEHSDELRAFLIGVLRSGDLASEALQSAFTKAMEAGHTARRETLKGWLFRVAFNEAMLLRRREQRRGTLLREIAWNIAGGDSNPESEATLKETIARVRQVLELLPVEQRTVVRMRIYEEKTFAAIAEELGIPLGTALTRMRLALQRLAERLDAEE